MIARRILCLGSGAGWHAEQISDACNRHGCESKAATYESLKAEVTSEGTSFHCDAGELTDFDLILTRTMPLGSFEQITFRLAVLHEVHERATNGNRGVTFFSLYLLFLLRNHRSQKDHHDRSEMQLLKYYHPYK